MVRGVGFALGVERVLRQRLEPESVPAVPGLAAAVHRPAVELAGAFADLAAGPGAPVQLAGDLLTGRLWRQSRPEHPAGGGEAGRAGIGVAMITVALGLIAGQIN